MTIRPLTTDDSHLYQLLRLKAVQTDPKSFLSTFEREKDKSAEQYISEIGYSYAPPIFGHWGAFAEDNQAKLLGYVQLGNSTLPKQAHIAFIYNLYIDVDERKQGIAGKLLSHVIYQIQAETQIERIFLSCNSQNKNALRFYKKIGFKRCGIKPRSVKWQDSNGQNQYDDEVEMVYLIKKIEN
jgi:ribosomal protein S18 acetylase RimI-like enzyme